MDYKTHFRVMDIISNEIEKLLTDNRKMLESYKTSDNPLLAANHKAIDSLFSVQKQIQDNYDKEKSNARNVERTLIPNSSSNPEDRS